MGLNSDIYKDGDTETLRAKDAVMRTQLVNSLGVSIADTFKFLAAVTLASGMAIIGIGLKSATTLAGAWGAITASPAGLAFIGVAAACTAIAITSSYVASRHYTSGNYDALEVNAMHTAKYLVKEIKKENACIAEQPGPVRADGKTWCQAEAERAAARARIQSL